MEVVQFEKLSQVMKTKIGQIHNMLNKTVIKSAVQYRQTDRYVEFDMFDS